MDKFPVAEILELPVVDRLRLVDLIWDSIVAVPEAVPVSDDLKAELAHRLAEFDADSETGLSWEGVRQRIRDGTWRSA